jgi:hypothetical protein
MKVNDISFFNNKEIELLLKIIGTKVKIVKKRDSFDILKSNGKKIEYIDYVVSTNYNKLYFFIKNIEEGIEEGTHFLTYQNNKFYSDSIINEKVKRIEPLFKGIFKEEFKNFEYLKKKFKLPKNSTIIIKENKNIFTFEQKIINDLNFLLFNLNSIQIIELINLDYIYKITLNSTNPEEIKMELFSKFFCSLIENNKINIITMNLPKDLCYNKFKIKLFSKQVRGYITEENYCLFVLICLLFKDKQIDFPRIDESTIQKYKELSYSIFNMIYQKPYVSQVPTFDEFKNEIKNISGQ